MSARITDRNGFFEVPSNPLSKAGVFPYLGKSINAPNPNATYMVYRPAAELADPETINSFRLVPLIDGHTMLGDPEKLGKPDYVPAEQKGVHGVIGDKIYFNPDDNTLYGNLKIFSSSLQDAIEAGKDDLSLGYHCKYVQQSGVSPEGISYDYIQSNIRGNHVAAVMAGRCGGDVSVMDSAIITFDEKEITMPETLRKRNLKAHSAIVKAVVGAYAKSVITKAGQKAAAKVPLAGFAMDAADDEAVASEPGLSDIADILGDVLPQIADINAAIADAVAPPADDDDMIDEMEPEMDSAGNAVMDAEGKPKMKAVMDAATGLPKKVKKTPPKPAMDGDKTMDGKAMDAAIEAATAPLRQKINALESGGIKTLLSEISKRNDLASRLSAFVGTFDHSEMTTQEVAAYGVKKLEIPTMDGQEISALTAYLHGRKANVPAARTGTGMDAAPGAKSGPLAAYLTGNKAA